VDLGDVQQLPRNSEVFLDHVGLFANDLRDAGVRLERLGFAVSPINLQQNADADGSLRPSGTSNRLAVMRRGFLEVLAATHATPLADQLKASLARYEGLHLIALSHADVARKRGELAAAGFPMQDVFHLRRHKDTPQGRREVAWSVLRPKPGVMAEGRVQFAYCHTPELTWDDAPEPPNGADTLTDTLLVVADVAEVAERYARYVDRPARTEDGWSRIELDRGALVFISRERASALTTCFTVPAIPFIAGQAISCRAIDGVKELLSRADVRPCPRATNTSALDQRMRLAPTCCFMHGT
jgi:hypothetical protein